MDSIIQVSLLTIARQAIEAQLAGMPHPQLPPSTDSDQETGGLFVSLHHGRRLRGCIGRMEGNKQPLPQLVQSMAVAVLDDPRFAANRVTLAELPYIDIEISVLSPMWRVALPLEMDLGVHGIYIRSGFQSGCFLPQVARDMRWNHEELLSHCCCDKAGLSADAWRDRETEIYLFTTEVFAETAR
jgi:AmmeMemoRadiSam system protein A